MSKTLQDIGLTEPADLGFDASKYDHWSQDPDRRPWLINKSQMAEFCGVALKTIDDWIRRGAPVYAYGDHGVSYQLDVAAFIEWTISYRSGVDIETLRERSIEERCKFQEQDKQLELQAENKRLRAELAALRREKK
jgi:phage terminase Nu1 subunit (DNA packaging protein)